MDNIKYVKKKVLNQRPIVIQMPRKRNLNNVKSSTYFNSEPKNIMKIALSSYVPCANKLKKTNSMLLDKELVKFAEPRSIPKPFFKIKPKTFEGDSESDSDNDFDEKIAVCPKNKSIGNFTCNNINDESFKQTAKKNERLNTTDVEQVEIKIPNDINWEKIYLIEKLFEDLIKDIEINKMEMFTAKNEIIKEFFEAMDSIMNVIEIFESDEKMNKHSLHRLCKDYWVEVWIFLITFIAIGKTDKVKEGAFSGIKNILFYLNQNYISFMFMLLLKYKGPEVEDENIKKLQKKVDDNKTWLTKTNYKKCILSNNKLSKNILRNILAQLKKEIDKEKESKIMLLLLYLKNPSKESIVSTYESLKENEFLTELKENENLEKEERPVPPFLPEKVVDHKYTLVLDLDETLVHYTEDEDNAYIQIRPGAEDFIDELSNYYEIVIFTAAMKKYADCVIDGIDKNKKISFRLYRQHTIPLGTANVKDLSKLGRDVTKTLIVDNYKENFSLQPENGIHIIDFIGDENDYELDYLKEDLIELAKENSDDVKSGVHKIQLKMDNRKKKETGSTEYGGMEYDDEHDNDNENVSYDNDHQIIESAIQTLPDESEDKKDIVRQDTSPKEEEEKYNQE